MTRPRPSRRQRGGCGPAAPEAASAGLTCGAPGPGAGGCEAQAAADSAGLFGHQTPGQNPAPGTRSPAQPAREAPRGGAGRGAARPTGFGVQVKAGAGPPESRSAPQG